MILSACNAHPPSFDKVFATGEMWWRSLYILGAFGARGTAISLRPVRAYPPFVLVESEAADYTCASRHRAPVMHSVF